MKLLSVLAAVLCFGLFTNTAIAQDKKATVLSIDGENISLEEFENIFRKNNRDSAINQKSLDDYMELFINFKLKVKAARELGLDTLPKFKSELEGYRSQLARPYMTDNSLLDDLVKEAYQRSTEEVRAMHILINCDPSAAPEDTLKAYNRIMAIRERIVKGEDFITVAKNTSEDPSAKTNGGDLGYFSAFQMVYPFEEAAYRTKVGDVSTPVRTRFGYHILKVADRRPSRGEMHVAHIMVKAKPETDSDKLAESKIEEIYQKLQKGETFEDLAAKFSDDGSSAKKGGELPWFGTGKMVGEFENAAFDLQADNDISEPFRTSYGWHIIKRLGYRPTPSFTEAEKEIKSKVSKDSRAEKTRASFQNKLKVQYNYQFIDKSLKPFLAKADTNVFKGQLKVKKSALKKTLFVIDGHNYPASDFYNYLSSRKTVRTRLTPQEFIKSEANTFANNSLMKYEDSKLEQKHDAFRLLMNEYREGILLFELTDQKVWTKAVKDSTGMAAYYEGNKDKFMWPERAEVTIYTSANSTLAKAARKLVSEGKDKQSISAELNKESQLNVQIEEGIFSKEDKDVLAKVAWAKGVSADFDHNGQTVFVDFKTILAPTPKKLSECRGLVTSEYQNYLEQEWISELRAKHKFEVNKSVLYTIK